MALIISGTTGITDGDFDYEDELNSKAAKTYVDSKPSGFKNYIINGGFDIWQRGGLSADANNSYSADRWHSWRDSGQKIQKGVSLVYGSYAHIEYTSGKTMTMGQRIEAGDSFNKFSGKTFTLSWDLFGTSAAMASIQGIKWVVYITHAGGELLIDSGAYYPVNGVRNKVTFTVPDLTAYTISSGSNLEVRPFQIEDSQGLSSSTTGLANVQLEEGSVATPFEQRPYGLELSLCQRYYQTDLRSGYTYTISGTTSAWRTTIPLLQPMRVAPTSFGFNGTIYFQGNTGGNILGTIGTTYNQINCIQFDGSFTANNGNNTGTEPMLANGGYFWASAEL